LTKILDFLLELFVNADRGFIILKTASGELEPVGWKTRRAADDEQIRISKTIVKQVMDSKRPMISSDAASDDRFDMAQSIVDFRIRSLMCAPLINSKEEVIGVIQLDTVKHGPNTLRLTCKSPTKSNASFCLNTQSKTTATTSFLITVRCSK